ncbi:MAG: ABC transporter permease [Rhodopirellula sp. TMED11]|nr:MAG: ABC transporter permease [Rhodopirellula sp. TMED11]
MKRKTFLSGLLEYGGLVLVLVLLVSVFSLATDHFLQWQRLQIIANQMPVPIMVAVGMTFVLIIGGIDLSVGSLVALSSAMFGLVITNWGGNVWMAVPLCILVGTLCGLINGAISVAFRIPAFIVTLGMLELARGATKVATDSRSIYLGKTVEGLDAPLPWLGLSPAILLALATVIIGQLVLTRTVFGRYCIAIGTNEETVRMSGVSTKPYRIAVFAGSGFLCALAGWAYVAKHQTVDPNAATGIELAAIAACVIGGTSLMGGRGNVVCTFIGVVIISVLQSGLAQMGVPDAGKQMITGLVIIVAALIDVIRIRLTGGKTQ